MTGLQREGPAPDVCAMADRSCAFALVVCCACALVMVLRVLAFGLAVLCLPGPDGALGRL